MVKNEKSKTNQEDKSWSREMGRILALWRWSRLTYRTFPCR